MGKYKFKIKEEKNSQINGNSAKNNKVVESEKRLNELKIEITEIKLRLDKIESRLNKIESNLKQLNKNKKIDYKFYIISLEKIKKSVTEICSVANYNFIFKFI
mgnify:CR=1 FL=1